MLDGEVYNPLDSELIRARERARDLILDLNISRESQVTESLGRMRGLIVFAETELKVIRLAHRGLEQLHGCLVVIVLNDNLDS